MAETTLSARASVSLERCTRVLASVGALAILCIAFLTIIDVGLRSIFSVTIRGLFEILILCLGIAIAACLPSGTSRAVHLALELFTASLPGAARRAFALLGTVMLLFFLYLAGSELLKVAMTYDARDQGTFILQWPAAPFFYAMAGLVLLCVPVQAMHVFEAGMAIARQGRGLGKALELLPTLAVLTLAVVIWGDALTAMPGYDLLRSVKPGIAALMFFGGMWVLMLLSVPLAAAMGLVGFIGIAVLIGPGPASTVVGTETAKFLTRETLAVLPLFLLMGSFASVAGLSSDIYRLAYELLKPLRGSLAHATIGGCAGFGALTGSSLATAATFGKIALPEMNQRNYDPALAAGSVAAGGTLGSLVPPSTALILYALLAEQSIGRLFIGAMVPAAIAIAFYIIAIWILLRFRPHLAPEGCAIDVAALIDAAKRCAGAVILFGVVMGSIYTGIVTDAEAASVGAVGAFLFALGRGKLAGGRLWHVLTETTTTIALIYPLIFGAVTFSFLIAFTQVPDLLAGWIVASGAGPITVVLLLVAIYLLLGMVMDSYAMMVITVPIFLPLVVQYGFDPIWWGVLTVVCVEMGMITPPFGMNIFILNSISKEITLPTIYRGVVPFVMVDLLKVALLILFPALVLWLPSQM